MRKQESEGVGEIVFGFGISPVTARASGWDVHIDYTPLALAGNANQKANQETRMVLDK